MFDKLPFEELAFREKLQSRNFVFEQLHSRNLPETFVEKQTKTQIPWLLNFEIILKIVPFGEIGLSG
jgi:hypothetical protein